MLDFLIYFDLRNLGSAVTVLVPDLKAYSWDGWTAFFLGDSKTFLDGVLYESFLVGVCGSLRGDLRGVYILTATFFGDLTFAILSGVEIFLTGVCFLICLDF